MAAAQPAKGSQSLGVSVNLSAAKVLRRQQDILRLACSGWGPCAMRHDGTCGCGAICLCSDACWCKQNRPKSGEVAVAMQGPGSENYPSVLVFAVHDDCKGEGPRGHQGELQRLGGVLRLCQVMPGLLGVECAAGADMEEVAQAVTQALVPRPLHLTPGQRVLSFAPTDHIPLPPEGCAVARGPGATVRFALPPAAEGAADLSLPLAKLRHSLVVAAPAATPPSGGQHLGALWLHVPTIKCQSCARKIERAFAPLGLVPLRDFWVNTADKAVLIAHQNKDLLSEARAVLGRIDLPPARRSAPRCRVQLRIRADAGAGLKAMTCKSCHAKLRRVLCRPSRVPMVGDEVRPLAPIRVPGVEEPVGPDAACVVTGISGARFELRTPGGHSSAAEVAGWRFSDDTLCAAAARPRSSPELSGTGDGGAAVILLGPWEGDEQAAAAAEELAAIVRVMGFGCTADGASQVQQDIPEETDIALSGWELHVDSLLCPADASAPTPPPPASPGTPPPPGTNPTQFTDSSVSVSGMTCGSCVHIIETHLAEHWGQQIQAVTVSLATNVAKVKHADSLTVAEICEEITRIGYQASPIQGDDTDFLRKSVSREDELAEYKHKATMALTFASPLILNMLFLMHLPSVQAYLMPRVVGAARVGDIAQLLLALPVIWYGRGFFTHGWADIRQGNGTMNVLVSLGVSTAYLSTLLRLFDVHTQSQADAGAILIAFMLVGKYLETMARAGTAGDMLGLLEMQPKSAFVVGEDGAVHEVPAATLRQGTVFVVRHGERVPADGEVISGQCAMDESMLTGESVPRSKATGDAVHAGSQCVDGTVRVRATHVGSESTISQIIKLVSDAQTNRAPIQTFADTLAGYFVPSVVAIALLSFAIWLVLGLSGGYPSEWRSGSSALAFAANFLLTSLVVACPCAMGLATPTAVMVASGVAARNGVFVKGAGSFEKAAKVKQVLFDKTGTLTTGSMTVVDDHHVPHPSGGIGELEVRAAVLAAESASAHPIAAAVAERCMKTLQGAPQPEVVEHTTTPGRGLKAVCRPPAGGPAVRLSVGSLRFISQELQQDLQGEAAAKAQRWERQGCTVVAAEADGHLRMIFALKDGLKPETPEVVRHLQRSGYTVYMVTGDSSRAAAALAREAGIAADCVRAETLPHQKADIVRQVSQSGMTAFVGDGVNDAPALAEAAVGIALNTGTSVAVDAADVVLTGSDLRGVTTLLSLSRVTLNRIKLNFAWAFGYNLVALPFAAGVFFPLWQEQLPPVAGGSTMILSSILVVTSSLLLKRFNPPLKKPGGEMPLADAGRGHGARRGYGTDAGHV
eukprot:TRINITY_DN15812_c0_g1_i1.p1 TRINITY_DN15812_c0_g1~~TRINITY_DN15812_c0_g1_i1.p1  ORF type:complete len:1315 (+),score=386.75 TRINITY_DN15812_c0_g1_i1:106-4050(+)